MFCYISYQKSTICNIFDVKLVITFNKNFHCYGRFFFIIFNFKFKCQLIIFELTVAKQPLSKHRTSTGKKALKYPKGGLYWVITQSEQMRYCFGNKREVSSDRGDVSALQITSFFQIPFVKSFPIPVSRARSISIIFIVPPLTLLDFLLCHFRCQWRAHL